MRRNLIVKRIANKTNSVQLSDLNHRMMTLIDNKNTCLNITNNKVDFYISWLPYGGQSIRDTEIGINLSVAEAIGLSEGDIVSCKLIEDLVSLKSVNVSITNKKDWEILETLSHRISSTLLDQAYILNEGKHIIVWVNDAINLTLKIEELFPRASYGRIDKNTEVIVNPLRAETKNGTPIANDSLSDLNEKNGNSLYDRLYKKSGPKEKMNGFVNVIDSRTLDTVIDKTALNEEFETSSTSSYTSTESVSEELQEKFVSEKTKLSIMRESHSYNLFESVFHELKSNQEKKSYKFRIIPKKWESKAQMCDVYLTAHNAPKDFDFKAPYVLVGETLGENDERSLREYYVNVKSSEQANHNPENIYPSIEVYDILLAELKLKKFSQISLSTKRTVLNFVEKIELIPLKTNNISIIHQDILEDFKRLIIKSSSSSPFLINQKQIFSCDGYFVMAKIFPDSFRYCLCDDEILRENKIFVVEQQMDISHLLSTAEEIGCQQSNEAEKSFINLCETEDIMKDCVENIIKYNCLDKQNRLRKKNNYLVIGSQTSGKSSLCNEIVRRLTCPPLYCYVEKINCAQNKSRKVDSIQKELRKSLRNCVEHAPSILLLENLDSISKATTDPSQNGAEYYNNVSDIIRNLIDSHTRHSSISVIATVTNINLLNQRLYTSRGNHVFETLYKIPDLTKDNRKKIIVERCKQHALNSELDFDRLSHLTEGYTIGFLLQFIDRAIFYAYRKSSKNPILTMNCLMESLKTTNKYCLQGIENNLNEENKVFALAGMKSIIGVFQEILMWPQQYPKIFKNSPLRNQAGILLFGAPGTGKTFLVSQISRCWNLRVIYVKGPELLAKFIGQSEENVRHLFDRARSAKPCVLFFDEFDSIAPRRGHDSTGVTDRVVNQLLTELDGVEELKGVVVVSATSRPDLIDPALLRSGRIDRLVQCPLPDAKERLQIFKSIALESSLQLAEDVSFETFTGSSSDYYTAADIKSILVSANMIAVKNSITSNDIPEKIYIRQCHMIEAFKSTKPSMSFKDVMSYEERYSKFMNKEESKHQFNKQKRTTLA